MEKEVKNGLTKKIIKIIGASILSLSIIGTQLESTPIYAQGVSDTTYEQIQINADTLLTKTSQEKTKKKTTKKKATKKKSTKKKTTKKKATKKKTTKKKTKKKTTKKTTKKSNKKTKTKKSSKKVSTTVYITNTGNKYHRRSCRYLRKSCYSISKSKAKSSGYSACKVCKP